MCQRICWLVLSSLLAFLVSQQGFCGEPLEVLRSRQDAFRNVSFGFSSVFTQAQLSGVELEVLEKKFGLSRDQYVFHPEESKQCFFSRLDDTLRLDSKFLKGEVSSTALLWTTKRCDILRTYRSERKGTVGHLSAPDTRQVPVSLVECALMIRCFGQAGFFSEASLEECVFRETEGKISVQCMQGGISHRWMLDPSIHYACTRYVASADGFDFLDVVCSDFEDEGGWLWPKKVVASRYSTARKGVVSKEGFTLTDFRLSDPVNSLESLRIAFPAESLVIDDRTGCRKRLDAESYLPEEELVGWCKPDGEARGNNSLFLWIAVAIVVLITLGVLPKKLRGR